MAVSQLDETGRQFGQGSPAGVLQQTPVHPADLVVLAVRVVVAALCATQLVARDQHRHTRRQQQRGEQVPELPPPERPYALVVRLPFRPAVPRPVVVRAVPVALAVRLVVLPLVRHQVPQGETVVRGDEVDRGVRPAPAPGVRVAGTGEAIPEIPYVRQGPPPEVAYGVAIAVVPLRPQGRERAHLIAP